MNLEAVKHYRGVAHLVLRWYLEPISGVLCLAGSYRSIFDVRVLQFQHDVDTVVDHTLSPSEQAFLFMLHGEGLSPSDCATLAPLRVKLPCRAALAALRDAFPDDPQTPGWLMQVAVETKLGHALVDAGLDRVREYFSRG